MRHDGAVRGLLWYNRGFRRFFIFFISSGAVSLKACTQCLVFAIIY